MAAAQAAGLLERPGCFALQHPSDTALKLAAAPIVTAGGCLDWARQVLLAEAGGDADRDYEALCAQAAASKAGSGGVLFLPWLAGERSPFMDPDARGAFIGLSLTTSKADMSRAILEGVAYSYRALLDVMPELDPSSPLVLAGGPGKSPLWMQILADVLQRRIRVVADAQHAGARGVALLAGIGLGWFASLSPPDFFPIAVEYAPAGDMAELHRARYAVHSSLHGSLKDSFKQLAASTGPS